MRINPKSIVPIIVLLVAVLPLIIPLLHSGFPITDDGEWMIIRFSAFYQELINGQFPVRWLNRLNNGYGYPVATFLYPGFMYIASLFKILGFGFINSVKLIIIGSVIAATISSYLWLREKFGQPAAIVGALFYVYNPYFLFDIYKRGSVGEILSLAVVAFTLHTIPRKRLALTGVAYGLLIISHNTLALLFLPILLLYQIKRTTLQTTLYSLVLGLGLSAFFWLPVLHELNLTKFNNTQINTSTFPLWNILPFSKYIQFPFRLLSLLMVASAYFSAFMTNYFMNLKHVRAGNRIFFNILLTTIIIIALFLQSRPFISKIGFKETPDDYYATNEATTTVQDEYMPIWVNQRSSRHSETIAEIIDDNGRIITFDNYLGKLNLAVDVDNKSILQISKIYWPGWRAEIDGDPAVIKFNNPNGLMQLELAAGKHNVALEFKETPFRKSATILSLSVFTFLLLKLILWKRV